MVLPLLRLNNTLLYVFTTFFSFVPLLRDTWFASPFWLLWINLPWTWMFTCLRDWYHFFRDVYPEVELLRKLLLKLWLDPGMRWKPDVKVGEGPGVLWKATYHRFTYWIRVLLRAGLGIHIFNKYSGWSDYQLGLRNYRTHTMSPLLPMGILWNLWMLSLKIEHGIRRGIINSHKRKNNQIIFNRGTKSHLKHIVRSLPLPCKVVDLINLPADLLWF